MPVVASIEVPNSGGLRVLSLRVFSSTALSACRAGVEAIGGKVTEESKVRNYCDKHDVSII